MAQASGKVEGRGFLLMAKKDDGLGSLEVSGIALRDWKMEPSVGSQMDYPPLQGMDGSMGSMGQMGHDGSTEEVNTGYEPKRAMNVKKTMSDMIPSNVTKTMNGSTVMFDQQLLRWRDCTTGRIISEEKAKEIQMHETMTSEWKPTVTKSRDAPMDLGESHRRAPGSSAPLIAPRFTVDPTMFEYQ